MSAPKGNQFWKMRSKHGRDRIFSSPDALWESCCEYFEYVESNPLWESKLFSYQGEIHEGVAPKMQAMTLAGLCLFLDIDETTWRDWRTKEDFSPVVAKADRVMYHQKFTGAAADQLNPNIIARDLGLKESSSVEHSGSVDINQMTDEELDRRLMALINESGKPN